MRVRRALVTLSLLATFLGSASCRLVVTELTWQPGPEDSFGLSEAYLSDSGLLLLCGSVSSTAFTKWANENDYPWNHVFKEYSLEIRLDHDEALDMLEQVDIDTHPTLIARRGEALCDFEEKRAKKRPGETGWFRIGFEYVDGKRVTEDDIRTGLLPSPKRENRASLYALTMRHHYLFVGQTVAGGPSRSVLLRLDDAHLARMWRRSDEELTPDIRIVTWGAWDVPEPIAAQRSVGGTVGIVDRYAEPVLIEQTTEIKAEVGGRFGIQHEATGIPERDTVPIKIRVEHPPIRGATLDGWDAYAQGNTPRYTGWKFRDRCDLVPGIWRFHVIHDGKRVATKEFQVSVDETDLPQPGDCQG